MLPIQWLLARCMIRRLQDAALEINIVMHYFNLRYALLDSTELVNIVLLVSLGALISSFRIFYYNKSPNYVILECIITSYLHKN